MEGMWESRQAEEEGRWQKRGIFTRGRPCLAFLAPAHSTPPISLRWRRLQTMQSARKGKWDIWKSPGQIVWNLDRNIHYKVDLENMNVVLHGQYFVMYWYFIIWTLLQWILGINVYMVPWWNAGGVVHPVLPGAAVMITRTWRLEVTKQQDRKSIWMR